MAPDFRSVLDLSISLPQAPIGRTIRQVTDPSRRFDLLCKGFGHNGAWPSESVTFPSQSIAPPVNRKDEA